MTHNERNKLVYKHYEELRKKYPDLKLISDDSGSWILQGCLRFSAKYKGETIDDDIDDEYNVEIAVPKNYPDEPPTAKEIGGRIPKDFHPGPNGTLCLEVPIEIYKKFSNRSSLLGFVEDLLIHFLFTYSYKEKYERLPFGEHSHGGEGIIEYYCKLLNVNDDISVLEFLRILADKNYRGHQNCPCKSGMRLRYCHGKQLIEIMQYHKAFEFLFEYDQALNYLLRRKKEKISNKQLSNRIIKKLKKL